MESFLNVKSLMDVKVVLFIVWIIMIFTSAEEERKYAKVRDRENFDTFNGTHVIILGHRREGDRLIYINRIDRGLRLFRKVTEHVKFAGCREVRAYITFIKVNQVGNEAMTFDFKMLEGGLGYEHALFEFVTHRNKGLHVVIRVFGFSQGRVNYILKQINKHSPTNLSTVDFINGLVD